MHNNLGKCMKDNNTVANQEHLFDDTFAFTKEKHHQVQNVTAEMFPENAKATIHITSHVSQLKVRSDLHVMTARTHFLERAFF